MMSQLVSTVLCPSRKVVSRRYGTVQRPVLLNEYHNYDRQLGLLIHTIPQFITQSLNSKDYYIILLGNMEGVMDVFVRRQLSSTPLSTWLRENNAKQTYDLIMYGLRRLGAKTSIREYQNSGLNLLVKNVYFASVQDLSFKYIKPYLPAQLSHCSSTNELISWFSDRLPGNRFSNELQACARTLIEKCPALRQDEVQKQVSTIRYGFRRAMGVLLECIGAGFGVSEINILSAFEPEILDQFHLRFDEKIIPTADHLSFQGRLADHLTREIILAGFACLTTPMPADEHDIFRKLLNRQDPTSSSHLSSVCPHCYDQTEKSVCEVDIVVGIDMTRGVTLELIDFLIRKSDEVRTARSSILIVLMPGYEVEILANIELPFVPWLSRSQASILKTFFHRVFSLADLRGYQILNDMETWEKLFLHLPDTFPSVFHQRISSVDQFSQLLGLLKLSGILFNMTLPKKLVLWVNGEEDVRRAYHAGLAGRGAEVTWAPTKQHHVAKVPGGQWNLGSNTFELSMRSPDDLLFGIFDLPQSSYSLENKLDCSFKITDIVHGYQTAEKAASNFFASSLSSGECSRE